MTNRTKIRRTEITIETKSLTIIRTRNVQSNMVYCRDCNVKTVIFQQLQAALIFRVEAGELERLSLAKQIHRMDELSFCGNSLADYFKKDIRIIED